MSIEITRYFSKDGQSPYDAVEWKMFQVAGFDDGVEAPAHWSANAVEIAATKYFRRRAGENSVRQLIFRVARTLRQAAEWQRFFNTSREAAIFEDEIAVVLLKQIASFNSPVYFNLGIFPIYGFMGTGQGFRFNSSSQQVEAMTSSYVFPQVSACFIQDVQDDLLSIFDLLKSEAKLFKFGSGSGTNFSRLRGRGEALEGGGDSTGLISYLEIFDKAAQAIKSGGTTRRAAKMVVVDADHPEILDFINWKLQEERKARVLLANGYSGGMEGEAFRTVSGQNSNNSVRVTDEFMKRVQAGGKWALRSRTHNTVVGELPAKDILRAMARAAWECADPGIQFHDTIQSWHTCPLDGEIRSSNPCSEYMFLDNSACNLASLNLVALLDESKRDLNWPAFSQAVHIMLMAQEIMVDYAAYPTAAIAENSHRFRPLGLGYANLGGLLMCLGVPYDSQKAGEWTAKITGALHALALKTSQHMADHLGPFAGWAKNREAGLNILEKHAFAWRNAGIDLPWVDKIYDGVLKAAESTGLRNAQVTLLAPTGTIGLLMDCDTLGIEPDFSLLKRKSLADGGEMMIANQAVLPALMALGYSAAEAKTICDYVAVKGTVVGAPHFKPSDEAVFDTAVPPQGHSHRRVTTEGHLRIMASAQPFLSGAISKTINLPASATVEDVEHLFMESWRQGLKSVAIYRDGSKALQPLCAEC